MAIKSLPPSSKRRWPPFSKRRRPARSSPRLSMPNSSPAPALSGEFGEVRRDAGERLEEVAEHGDQRLVGGRHRIVGEPSRPHPGKALSLPRDRDPRPLATDIERHQQVKLGIGVRGEREWSKAARGNVDAEFLAEL